MLWQDLEVWCRDLDPSNHKSIFPCFNVKYFFKYLSKSKILTSNSLMITFPFGYFKLDCFLRWIRIKIIRIYWVKWDGFEILVWSLMGKLIQEWNKWGIFTKVCGNAIPIIMDFWYRNIHLFPRRIFHFF